MSIFSRIPFTLAFLIAMGTANWLAGTFTGILPPQALTAWGISHTAILNGEAYRLITGTFLSHDIGMFTRQICFAAAAIGSYEWLEGTRRVFTLFFSADVLGSLLVLFGVLPLLVGHTDLASDAALFTHDVGMSAGGFGLIGALIAKKQKGWLLLSLALGLIAIKIEIHYEVIADTAHIVCLLLGFALQAILNALHMRQC